MMRTAAALFSLSLCVVGCDVPKSVGDEPVEDDAQDTTSTTTAGTATTGGSSDSATSTSGSPTAGGGVTTTPADSETSGLVCADFDKGPYDGPGEFEWLCACESCDLPFPDVPPATIDLFEEMDGSLCECLCQQAGCGSTEGEGGVGTGADTEWGGDTESGDTEWGGSSTTTPTDTDPTDTAGGTSDGTSDGFPDTDGSAETGTPV